MVKIKAASLDSRSEYVNVFVSSVHTLFRLGSRVPSQPRAQSSVISATRDASLE